LNSLKRWALFLREYFHLESKSKLVRKLFIAHIVTVFSCVVLLLPYTLLTKQPNGVGIEEVVLTATPGDYKPRGDQVYKFNHQAPRIYCYITPRGIFGLPLKATTLIRWYRDTEQLTGHSIQVESGQPTLVWLEPPAGQTFRPGQYAVKVFIQGMLLGTVKFEIE
jgi:hypothetical protein